MCSSDLTDISSSGSDQFIARASGGVKFFSNAAATSGVKLNPGGGSWSSLSDRKAKENFAPVKPREVLDRLNQMPIQTWNYKSQDAAVRHLGPMAQDFYAAFGLGDDAEHINTVDAQGVALAAVQGLHQLVAEKDAQVAALAQQHAAQQDEITALQAQLAAQGAELAALKTEQAARQQALAARLTALERAVAP